MTSDQLDSILGEDGLTYGPANIYTGSDLESGGSAMNLGGFDTVKIQKSIKKIGLRKSQHGDRDADRAVSAQEYIISFGMAEANIDRIEEVSQDIHVVRDASSVPTRIEIVDVIGQRDSDVATMVKTVEILNGVESTNPLKTLYWLNCAPVTENVELVYDATTQRFFQAAYFVYRSTIQNSEGKYLYARTGTVS